MRWRAVARRRALPAARRAAIFWCSARARTSAPSASCRAAQPAARKSACLSAASRCAWAGRCAFTWPPRPARPARRRSWATSSTWPKAIIVRLPPLASVLHDPDHPNDKREITVQLATVMTEVGTLEVHCVAENQAGLRWLLEFQLRGEEEMESRGISVSPRVKEAVDKIERIFGGKAQKVDAQGSAPAAPASGTGPGRARRLGYRPAAPAVRRPAAAQPRAGAAPPTMSACG